MLRSIKELSTGFDNIFYIFADCPCLDNEISLKMYSNHIKYFADYTFADGYPYGITPEILNKDIVNNLIQLAKNSTESIKRDTIFELIKKDINDNCKYLRRDLVKNQDCEYVQAINEFEGNFDCIIIDGRNRSLCVDQAINRLNKNGLIILDNSEREKYQYAIQKLNDNYSLIKSES